MSVLIAFIKASQMIRNLRFLVHLYYFFQRLDEIAHQNSYNRMLEPKNVFFIHYLLYYYSQLLNVRNFTLFSSQLQTVGQLNHSQNLPI